MVTDEEARAKGWEGMRREAEAFRDASVEDHVA